MESFFILCKGNVSLDELYIRWRAKRWGEPFMPERRKLLTLDGINYICYNAAYVPHLPKAKNNLERITTVGLGRLMHPQWLNSRHPFLGYAPRILRNAGLLTELVNPKKHSIIEQTIDGKFKMRQNVLEKWIDAEACLYVLQEILAQETPLGKNPWPLEFRHYTLPSFFGYCMEYETLDAATKSAVQSRDAFRGLIASTRMYVALNRLTWVSVIAECGAPSTWIDGLVWARIVPHDDVSSFEDCVGAFVNMDNLDSLSVIEAHIRLGMPIWIRWGSNEDALNHWKSDTELRRFWEIFHPRPSEICQWTRLELSTLPNLGKEVFDNESFDNTNDAALDLDPIVSGVNSLPRAKRVTSYGNFVMEDGIPLPYLDCGQLKGESPHDFIARRKCMLAPRITRETPKDREARLARARHAQGFVEPGKKGAVCFEWIEVIPNHFLRTRVTRLAIPDVWSNYSQSAKVYDELQDEWDLWDGFDLEKGPTEEEEFQLNTGMDLDGKQIPEEELKEMRSHWTAKTRRWMSSRKESEPSAQDIRSFFARNAARLQREAEAAVAEAAVADADADADTEAAEAAVVGPAAEEPDAAEATTAEAPKLHANAAVPDAVQPDIAGEDTADNGDERNIQWPWEQTLLETATLRFGYRSAKDLGDVQEDENLDDGHFAKCLFRMYAPGEMLTKVSRSTRRNVMKLIRAIENSEGDVSRLPENLCDLCDDPSQRLGLSCSSVFSIKIKDILVDDEHACRKPALKRSKRTLDAYLLSPKYPSKWAVALLDPDNVLECARFHADDFISMVRHLVERGIPFHTVQSDGQQHNRSSRDNFLFTPIRLPGSAIQHVDYVQYEARLTALATNNQRVCRAALMRGGIIWRLIIDVVGMEVVFDGPSQESLSPVMNCTASCNIQTWYDDELTREEEHIICGVYRSSDEPLHKCAQLWSFWPTGNVWDISSVNAGYWTWYNEQWFIKRKSALRAASPSDKDGRTSTKRLYYQREWREMLKGQKKAGIALVKNNRELARQCLQKELGCS